MRNLSSFVALAILSAAIPAVLAAASDPLMIGDKAYTQLTGQALLDAIVGNSFHEPDCRDTTGCFEAFKADGETYWVHGDWNPQIQGTYHVSNSQVCVTVSKTVRCRKFFAGPDGSFASLPGGWERWNPIVYERIIGTTMG